MLIWTAKLSKKAFLLPLLLFLSLILAFLCTRMQKTASTVETMELLTNEDRLAYLSSWGWEVTPEPLETLQFVLPEPLDHAYAAYAQLQTAQGFTFADYAGAQVSRYTYAVTNYPGHPQVQLNLYLCDGRPIGGDVFAPGAGGFQAGLSYPENH